MRSVYSLAYFSFRRKRMVHYGSVCSVVTTAKSQVEPSSDQIRKKSELICLLSRLIDEAQDEHSFGEFSVSFSTQSGKIGHYEVNRKTTYK